MENIVFSAFVVLLFVGFIFYYSQQKLKNKLYCTFIRPNRHKIEAWVPLFSKYVVFDRGKYGIGHYEVDPECITLMWYTRGFNKFFPVLIPTLDFKWDTPNPLNPKTFQSTWHTPEARQAAWEEHQHIAYAKATAVAAGKASRIPAWLFPAIMVILLLAVLYLTQAGMGGLDKRMFDLEQQLKLLH